MKLPSHLQDRLDPLKRKALAQAKALGHDLQGTWIQSNHPNTFFTSACRRCSKAIGIDVAKEDEDRQIQGKPATERCVKAPADFFQEADQEPPVRVWLTGHEPVAQRAVGIAANVGQAAYMDRRGEGFRICFPEAPPAALCDRISNLVGSGFPSIRAAAEAHQATPRAQRMPWADRTAEGGDLYELFLWEQVQELARELDPVLDGLVAEGKLIKTPDGKYDDPPAIAADPTFAEDYAKCHAANGQGPSSPPARAVQPNGDGLDLGDHHTRMINACVAMEGVQVGIVGAEGELLLTPPEFVDPATHWDEATQTPTEPTEPAEAPVPAQADPVQPDQDPVEEALARAPYAPGWNSRRRRALETVKTYLDGRAGVKKGLREAVEHALETKAEADEIQALKLMRQNMLDRARPPKEIWTAVNSGLFNGHAVTIEPGDRIEFQAGAGGTNSTARTYRGTVEKKENRGWLVTTTACRGGWWIPGNEPVRVLSPDAALETPPSPPIEHVQAADLGPLYDLPQEDLNSLRRGDVVLLQHYGTPTVAVVVDPAERQVRLFDRCPSHYSEEPHQRIFLALRRAHDPIPADPCEKCGGRGILTQRYQTTFGQQPAQDHEAEIPCPYCVGDGHKSSSPVIERVMEYLRDGKQRTNRDVQEAVEPGVASGTYSLFLNYLKNEGLITYGKSQGRWQAAPDQVTRPEKAAEPTEPAEPKPARTRKPAQSTEPKPAAEGDFKSRPEDRVRAAKVHNRNRLLRYLERTHGLTRDQVTLDMNTDDRGLGKLTAEQIVDALLANATLTTEQAEAAIRAAVH